MLTLMALLRVAQSVSKVIVKTERKRGLRALPGAPEGNHGDELPWVPEQFHVL